MVGSELPDFALSGYDEVLILSFSNILEIETARTETVITKSGIVEATKHQEPKRRFAFFCFKALLLAESYQT